MSIFREKSLLFTVVKNQQKMRLNRHILHIFNFITDLFFNLLPHWTFPSGFGRPPRRGRHGKAQLSLPSFPLFPRSQRLSCADVP